MSSLKTDTNFFLPRTFGACMSKKLALSFDQLKNFYEEIGLRW